MKLSDLQRSGQVPLDPNKGWTTNKMIVNTDIPSRMQGADRNVFTRAGQLLAAGVLAVGLLLAWTNAAMAAGTGTCPTILDLTLPRLQDEQPQNLCQFSGKVVLVVNTASACGYTPQYEGLQKLHDRYAARGLVIAGFPSDDFRQEPRNNKGIAEQCFDTFGVRFPMFAKTGVVGQTANPLFAALARETGEAPKWNFHKYLIDRQGRPVASLPSAVEPLDRRLTSRIEQLLAAR